MSSALLLNPFRLRFQPRLSPSLLILGLTPLALGLTITQYPHRHALLLSDYSPAASSSSNVPIFNTSSSNSTSTLNPAAIKQISLGSILGLCTGVAVSVFSRTLTLLLGVGVVVVQVS